ERQARAARPTPTPALRIGRWRESKGLSPDSSGPGPLRDLPDWSFVDGRPSPLWRGQLRRLKENEEMARRVLKLSKALDVAKAKKEATGEIQIPQLRPKGSQYRPVQST
ncbi:PREDICTED: 39S ribosomal protein L52, mitochondrial, partial [Acanthisitta chloris]|uniref:39S ribosomal protein L52, mitochondrial n=1 Tax=Acanthisitta chloris TaxID=57068 RepID=UPI0004F0F9CE